MIRTKTQLHISNGHYPITKEHFHAVENMGISHKQLYQWNAYDYIEAQRPSGGFWTSTYDKVIWSDWVQWNLSMPNGGLISRKTFYATLIQVSEHANVYELDTYEDLEKLMYHNRRTAATNKSRKIPLLDFERLSKKYDGLHLTKHGVKCLEESEPYFLKYWDVESTLWFNLDAFSSIEEIGRVTCKQKGA